MPVSAAAIELRYSASRSMDSSSPSCDDRRATNGPSGVVTLRLMLVSPPVSVLDRPRSAGQARGLVEPGFQFRRQRLAHDAPPAGGDGVPALSSAAVTV